MGKQIDKDLKQTEKEIRSFQTEKQVRLNQFKVPVPLRLSQLCCFPDDETTTVPETTAGGKVADSLAWYKARTEWSLVSEVLPKEQVLFDGEVLLKQYRRIGELEEECKNEGVNFKDL